MEKYYRVTMQDVYRKRKSKYYTNYLKNDSRECNNFIDGLAVTNTVIIKVEFGNKDEGWVEVPISDI